MKNPIATSKETTCPAYLHRFIHRALVAKDIEQSRSARVDLADIQAQCIRHAHCVSEMLELPGNEYTDELRRMQQFLLGVGKSCADTALVADIPPEQES